MYIWSKYILRAALLIININIFLKDKRWRSMFIDLIFIKQVIILGMLSLRPEVEFFQEYDVEEKFYVCEMVRWYKLARRG